jgi:hypothetical protein
MPKLTVDDIVPGELYVFTDASPAFSAWVGLVARAIRHFGDTNTDYVFELIELTDRLRSLGYTIGELIPISVELFKRYQLSTSDQLFN